MRTLVVAGGLLALGTLAGAQALGTAFTYQGRLADASNPANGPYDLQLALFDAASGGAQVGPTLTRDDIVVSDGLFTTSLDFGAVFAGSRRWLELRVRPGASAGSYTTLAGRQELTPSPNAVFSSVAPWAGISGKPAGFADDIDDDSGGDITAVTAGTGLTGGGTAGAVTVGVNLGGGGSATTVARSDHDHFAQAWSGGFPASQGLRVTNTATGGFSDGIFGQGDGAGQARGVVGYATSPTGQNFGVWGQADSPDGRGVFGLASAAAGPGAGVVGQTNSSSGHGVQGIATATVGFTNGVFASIASPQGAAVRGIATTTTTVNIFGVFGSAPGAGVNGEGPSLGVRGFSPVEAVRGVTNGTTSSSFAIRGVTANPNAYAGYFEGRVNVTGTLTKGGGAFKIDHPLDPENKYLYHSFVESPDMMNIYNGNVTTDGEGYASVDLPKWFEALNRDFRYQLTVIGQFAQAIVARKVEGNTFAIRTDKPNVEVSWQVTGVRHDPFAEAHRVPLEEDKPEAERGKYMHPVEHGQPQAKGVGWEQLVLSEERMNHRLEGPARP